MKKHISFRCMLAIALLMCFFAGTTAIAEELRYKAVNPQFGGSPLNGGALLAKASAQNIKKTRRQTPTEKFEETVQQAILSRVSREVADSILGENAKDSGSIELGDLNIEFKKVNGEIQIQVREDGKQGLTEINIPAPVF